VSLIQRLIGPFELGGVDTQPAIWPVGAYTFARYPSSLFSHGAAGAWDSNSAYAPTAARNLDGTTYVDGDGYCYVFYSGSLNDGNETDRTGLFKTKDFQSTVRVSNSAPVINLGGVGDPDRGDAQTTSVIHDGTNFHAWYIGNATAPGGGADSCTICYATSADGITWTKHGRVVNVGVGDDSADIYDPKVILKDGTFTMVASGHNASGQLGMMKYTASNIAGPWSRASTSYVFRPSANIYMSDFWFENEAYNILYAKPDGEGYLLTWHATSADGITWTERRQVAGLNSGGAWDRGAKYNCAFVRLAAGSAFLLFNCNAYVEGLGVRRIDLGGSAPTITSSQTTYTNVQGLSFPFTGAPLPASSSAWVGVYPATGGALVNWRWTDNTQVGSGTGGIASGSVSFPADTFDPGSYLAKLIFDGNTIATASFAVSN
jgi:hypothetical protein